MRKDRIHKIENTFRILLDDNNDSGVVQIHAESGGLLKGAVVLDCQGSAKCVRLRSIVLKLKGKAKIVWVQEGQHYWEERTIIHHRWVLLPPPSRAMHSLCGQQYRWSFALYLPSELPATIQDQDNISISYSLKATGERPTFSPNFVCKRSLRVARYLPEHVYNDWNVAGSFDINNDLLSHRITLPSPVCVPGSTAPIRFEFEPRSPSIAFIRSITCILKSYVTLSTGRHSGKRTYALAYLRDDHFTRRHQEPPSWIKTEHLKIPDWIPGDTDYDLVRITHKLKIAVNVVKTTGETMELRTSIPVIVGHVVDNNIHEGQDDEFLPAYDTLCSRSPSYHSMLSSNLQRWSLSSLPSYAP
ncbi:hypothetical protein VTP01DRAFT_2965 [Rhizomucor pusillus]|uniref:uncharacterized protein n=1 Tax=Rhizomucor pusillus TaxID=4840 RepID=UPI0037442C33